MSRAGPSLFGLAAVFASLARPFETGWVSAVPALWLPWPGARVSLSHVHVQSQDPIVPR